MWAIAPSLNEIRYRVIPFLLVRRPPPAVPHLSYERLAPDPTAGERKSAPGRRRPSGRGPGQDSRYRRTASPRRWSASDGGRPSLLKMLPTCFSTDRSETTRISAMAALDRPSAISASTSRSLGGGGGGASLR